MPPVEMIRALPGLISAFLLVELDGFFNIFVELNRRLGDDVEVLHL